MDEKLNSQAYEYLKKCINDNVFAEDTIYSETSIAKDIGFSRTPIRDAVRRLGQEGFLEVLPSKGFRLKEITRDGIRKTHQFRCALEGYCTVLLARENQTERSKHHILLMKQQLDMQQHVYDSGMDVEAFAVFDQRFHHIPVEYADNEEMSNIFRGHMHYMYRLANKTLHLPERMENTLEEHDSIYQAVLRGDANASYNAILQHLDVTHRLNMQLLDEGL